MPFPLFNRVKQAVASAPGAGTITLGAATSGLYQTFAQAGARDGLIVNYVLEDGANWEYGAALYSSSGPTLTRTTIFGSSSSGAAINASASAVVFCDVFAEELGSSLGIGRIDPNVYHFCGRGSTGYGTAATNLSANQLQMTPFYVHRRAPFTKIGCRVNTATAGNTVRLGLWQESPTGQPGKLILDAGSVTTDTAAIKELAISITLNPGRYFTGIVTPATQSMYSLNYNSTLAEFFDSSYNGHEGFIRNFTYATAFGDETAQTYSYLTQTPPSIVHMRN